jgi:hypothetical protein
MPPTDDIREETPASQNERDIKRQSGTRRRKIDPESEDRGGPEAPGETLDEHRDGNSEPAPEKS